MLKMLMLGDGRAGDEDEEAHDGAEVRDEDAIHA